MKKKFLALALSAALIVGALPAYGAPETEPLKDYGTPGVDYVEGEAIVCLDHSRAGTGEAMLQGSGGYRLESLMELEGSGQETAASQALLSSGYEPAGGQEAARELILVTADDGQTTPELIRELEENPAVVFAEPNTLYQAAGLPKSDETASDDAESSFAPETSQNFSKIEEASGDPTEASSGEEGFTPEKAFGLSPEAADTAPSTRTASEANEQAGDLTPWQWCYSNPHYPQYTLNASSLYQAGITGEDVVVAVVDSGVDYTHPDLAPQMWDEGLSYPALTALGGGRYGINAGISPFADSTDPMDYDGHGTHCAGIITSAWNGQGTDGVAGGARLMALKIDSEAGYTTSAALKAYRYMKAARESGVNLRAANNSWVNREITRALHLAIEELGRAGILSVFCSGNEGQDLSTFSVVFQSASLTPSLLAVNALDYQGEQSRFTNWGLTHTTIYAPGSSILSTIPTDRAEYCAVMAQDNLLYTGFEGGENPAGDRADILDEAGSALSFFEYDLETGETGEPIPLSGDTLFGDHALFLELEPYDEKDIISSPITLAPQEGPVYFSFSGMSPEYALLSAWLVTEEGPYRLKLYNNSKALLENDAVFPYHLWNNFYGEIPREAMEKPFRLAFSCQAQSITSPCLYLDGIGIGTQTHPYGLMSGTSMATPMVTGAAALLFSAYPGETAEEISARITGGANRTESPSLSPTCISGGILDLKKALENPDPAVQQILDTGKSVTLKGRFFGDAPGEVSMGGVPVSVLSWTDGEIAFLRPEGRTFSGMTEFSVTRTDGAWGRNFRMYDEGNSAYETLPLPAESPDYPGSNMELLGNQLTDISTAVAALGGRLYFTTGTHSSGNYQTGLEPVTELWCYDIAARAWQRLKDLPDPMLNTPSLCAFKGSLYLLGTAEREESSLPVLYTYDPASDTWNGGLTLRHPYAFDGTLLNYREKLLLIGGLDIHTLEMSDGMWELDPATGACQEFSLQLPEPIYRPNIAVFGENREQLLLAQFYSNGDHSNIQSTFWWFDGENWTIPDRFPIGEIYSYGFLGLGGGAEGVMITGIQRDPGTAQYRDTAFFRQGKAETWEDVYFPGATYSHRGIAYDGYYYVLSRSDELPESQVFKRIPLRTADASEEPLPTVTPTPEGQKKAPPAKDPVGDSPRKYGQAAIPRPKMASPLE